MSRPKPKTKIEREERQLLLGLLHVLYVEAPQPSKKPPQPDTTGPNLRVMQRKAAGAA